MSDHHYLAVVQAELYIQTRTHSDEPLDYGHGRRRLYNRERSLINYSIRIFNIH
nr:hypothetical protein Itr_chr01CG21640 [Ipomoea trifida]